MGFRSSAPANFSQELIVLTFWDYVAELLDLTIFSEIQKEPQTQLVMPEPILQSTHLAPLCFCFSFFSFFLFFVSSLPLIYAFSLVPYFFSPEKIYSYPKNSPHLISSLIQGY